MTQPLSRCGSSRSIYRLLTLVSTMSVILAATGCRKVIDYRISLSEFQRVAAQLAAENDASYAPQWKQATDAANIDKRLGAYTIGSADTIKVTLTTEDQQDAVPPLQARVDEQGRIQLVMAGKLKVAGKSFQEAEEAIHAAYVPRYFQRVSVHVELVDAKPTNVIVLGAVPQPGMVSLRRNDRDLLHAVLAAGGMTALSSGDVTLQRIRQPDHHVTVNLTDPVGIKTMMSLPPLAPGDLITVHAAKPNTFYIGGLVNAPQRQTYPSGVKINVLQALAGSYGLRTDVTPTEATLIRRMPNGKDAHVRLDLIRLTRGLDPNIDLEPGDILWVPETTHTRVQDFINRTIYFRAGVSYNLIGTQDLFTGDRQDINSTGTTFLGP